MKRLFILPAVALVIALLSIGCENESSNDISKIVFPDSNVSFRDKVMPVIAANCALSGCHGPVTGTNANPMYDYYTLVQDTRNLGLVWPGQPDASRLVFVIEYKGPLHYPPYKWNINGNQSSGIRVWIKEGAKNN